MIFRMRHPATVLAMMLAGAVLQAQVLPELPSTQLLALTQAQPARVAQAAAWIQSQAAALGLTSADAFTLRRVTTNLQGECVARFDQTNQGNAVVGASVVVKVSPAGAMSIAGNALVQNIKLPAAAAQLAPAQALAVLEAKLSPTVGFGRPPSIQAIVFPTRLMGDMVLAKDESTGLLAMDPLRSAEGYTPAAPHVRGYQIVCDLLAAGQPDVTLTVVMDADTGAILNRTFSGPTVTNPFAYATGHARITSGPFKPAAVRTAAAVRRTATGLGRPLAAATATAGPGMPTLNLAPAVGLGYTIYSGPVFIPTSFDPVLNGYGLLDITRGSGANHFVQDRMGYYDQYNQYHQNTQRPSGNIVVADTFDYYVPYTMDGISGSEDAITNAAAGLMTGLPATTGNILKDNLWGNYTDFQYTTDATTGLGVFSDSGKTAGAEAMNSMTNAYEFFKYAFNRVGVDGQDSAMTAIVNSEYYPGEVVHFTVDNQNTDPVTGAPIALPGLTLAAGCGVPAYGIMNAAEPTLLGQAISDMLWEWELLNGDSSSIREGKDVQRGFSNVMSQAIMSLGALHGMQRMDVLPTYTVGQNYTNGYAVSMYQPSADGVSPNGWYDGICFLGNESPQYGEGPMDRAGFFLAEYASANPSDPNYSPYLPAGMTGIGLEKTAKIFYKALTERIMDPGLSYADMRAACLQAATDLYGPASKELIATTNAFAAVNVGGAYGAADPVRVWFDAQNFPAKSDLGIDGPFEPNPRMGRYPIVPMNEPTQLSVHVTGAADTSVTWTCNPAPYSGSGYYNLSLLQNGAITADGVYTSSLRQPNSTINVYSVQATSKADPLQWAQGMITSLSFDNDGDGTNDALDLAMLALCYDLPFQIYDQVNYRIMWGFPGIGEGELQMNLAAFKTAFCN